MKVVLLAAMAIVIAALAGLSAFGVWLGTEEGRTWLFAQIERETAPYLRYTHASGSWRRLTFHDVRLALPGQEITADFVTLAWQPAGLLEGRLVVDELSVGPARYRTLPQDGPRDGANAAGFSAPLPIMIHRLELAGLDVVHGDAVHRIESLRLAAELRGQRLELRGIELNGPSLLRLLGAASLELGDALGYMAEFDWTYDLGGQASEGRLEVEGRWPELELRNTMTMPAPAVLEGSVVFDEPARADMTLVWSDWTIATSPHAHSQSGRLRVRGTIDAFEVEGAASLALANRALELVAQGTGARERLSFERLAVTHAGGELRATGSVDIGRRDWELALAAVDIDPAWWSSAWPGRLNGSASFAGSLVPEPQWSLTEVELAGELREQPVSARGALAFAGESWRVEDFEARSETTSITLQGRLDARAADLEFALTSEDLATLWPAAAGAVRARGALEGQWSAPRVELELTARELALASFRVAELSVRGAAGTAADAPLDLRAELQDLSFAKHQLDDLDLRASGSTGNHIVAAAASLPLAARMTLAAHGGWADGRWEGRVRELGLEQNVAGRWTLTEEAPLRLAAGVGMFGPSCLAHDATRVCAEVALTGDASDRLELRLTDFELSALEPLLGESLSLMGRYDAALTLMDPLGEVDGALRVEGAATRLTLQTAGEDPFIADFDRVALDASLSDWTLDLTANVRGGADGTGDADLTARFTDVRLKDPELDATVRVHWPDVAILALLSSDLGEVGGAGELELSVTGTVATPHVSGGVAWRAGRIGVPRWGLLVEEIEANGTSLDGRTLVFNVSGEVAGSRLHAEGETVLDHRAGWPTRLALKGDTVQIVQLPDAEVHIEPDLTVQARLPDINVTGTVRVPRARIALVGLPEQAVSPSPDVVTYGVAALEPTRPLRLHSRLELELGNDVRYTGAGLEALVTGQLSLAYDSGRSAVANGALSLTGSYDAYGQALSLERGELAFAGPLGNPVIDVRAVRHIEAQTVGVQLGGTLMAPEARIFSEPLLSEADALAYLLFGQPLSSGTEQESAVLQSAALSLGLQQALPVVERIGQSLGLDELTVQSTMTGPGALMAGKYLSPRVYIRYSYGLFNRIGGFLLRFRVNDRLSLETRSGDEKSLDVLYTVEKD